MTSEKTIELEQINKQIRDILMEHNCSIKISKNLKCTIIADNDNPNNEYIFASGLIQIL